jgi:hypothetical protein
MANVAVRSAEPQIISKPAEGFKPMTFALQHPKAWG